MKTQSFVIAAALVAGAALTPLLFHPARGQSPTAPSVRPTEARQIGEGARYASFGATGRYFAVDQAPSRGTVVKLPVSAGARTLLQQDTLAAFVLDQRQGRWLPVEGSRFSARDQAVLVSPPRAGVYTVLGASRFSEVYDAQKRLCGAGADCGQLPRICQQLHCPAEGISELVSGYLAEVPGAIGAGELAGYMGGVCEVCTSPTPGTPADFPECSLPGLTTTPAAALAAPAPLADDLALHSWPAHASRFDARNACVQGKYQVGQVDYDFEDDFDLVPAGSTTPAYPGVDVRATVRYPASSAGMGKPVAGNRTQYPLVVFLHGNHVTCPCSCSHSCPKADRVPNHLGYNYLLDLLASWGFIAVSIDGFDVTCAGNFAMSDYEARGRLVLKHLERWRGWGGSGGDPWGGLFRRRVDMRRIGLSGHSRGGEGVVAAEFINRSESLGFRIRAINAIAPTDQDPAIRYVPEVPYFLLMAASDGDVSNLQGLRTYDRTAPTGAPRQPEKSMLWVYGANHNFFNTVWSPSSGAACASDDGIGGGRLADSLQRLVGCQSIVPFFRLHLQDVTGFRKLFRGEVVTEGLDGVRKVWTFQSPHRLPVDDFEGGDDPQSNALGGAVTATGGFSVFDEFELKNGGPDTFNASFRHFTHGLVLGWNDTQTYETVLPAGSRDVSSYSAFTFRASAILDGGTQNPPETPRALRVILRTASGTESNVGFDAAGLQSLFFPYPDAGGKTVLGTVRVPLSGFRKGTGAMPLNDIERVKIELRGTGLVALDDIQFTK